MISSYFHRGLKMHIYHSQKTYYIFTKSQTVWYNLTLLEVYTAAIRVSGCYKLCMLCITFIYIYSHQLYVVTWKFKLTAYLFYKLLEACRSHRWAVWSVVSWSVCLQEIYWNSVIGTEYPTADPIFGSSRPEADLNYWAREIKFLKLSLQFQTY